MRGLLVRFVVAVASAALFHGALAVAARSTPPPRATTTALTAVNWAVDVAEVRTAVTLEVDIEPAMFQDPVVAQRLWVALEELGADLARFSPWGVYPRVGTAELAPPDRIQNRTFWNFTVLDAAVARFARATAGHEASWLWSTIPHWMFKDGAEQRISPDTWRPQFSYTNCPESGSELHDPTCTEVADYLGRLYSWYALGGFVDELGVTHHSGHHYNLTYMAVLNEPNNEHCWGGKNSSRYFTCYAAISSKLKALNPAIQLAAPEMGAIETFFDEFLEFAKRKNQLPDTLTIHPMWETSCGYWNQSSYDDILQGLDINVNQCRDIATKARAMFPGQKLAAAESGVILAEQPCGGWTNQSSACSVFGTCPPHPSPLWLGSPIPPPFWNAAASAAVQLWGRLAELDFEFVTIDQFFGGEYPNNFPSVTMMDPEGIANAKYWALHMLIHNASGTRAVKTLHQAAYDGSVLYVLPLTTPDGQRLVVASRLPTAQNVDVCTAFPMGAVGVTIDAQRGSSAKPLAVVIECERDSAAAWSLGPWGVAVFWPTPDMGSDARSPPTA
jgi:hypothetical protein